ncbi:MAG TPA: hypothetical protein VJ809_14160, partial [Pirellulales bacterium]|nr:hypothetical protein [Pirellulales bacterium]
MQSALPLRLCVSLVLLLAFNERISAEAPHVLLVVGAEGTSEFGGQFATWTDRWQKAAGQASAKITIIGSGKEQPTQTDEST